MSQEKALISIIIPVYKVEKYLEKCIQSVINQTYENLQIILVDIYMKNGMRYLGRTDFRKKEKNSIKREKNI